jgi:hypothetical protein
MKEVGGRGSRLGRLLVPRLPQHHLSFGIRKTTPTGPGLVFAPLAPPGFAQLALATQGSPWGDFLAPHTSRCATHLKAKGK